MMLQASQWNQDCHHVPKNEFQTEAMPDGISKLCLKNI